MASLQLAADELQECAFFPIGQAVGRLHRAAAYTLPIAAQARADGVPRFLSHAELPEPLLDYA
jgi:hypothetical protein